MTNLPDKGCSMWLDVALIRFYNNESCNNIENPYIVGQYQEMVDSTNDIASFILSNNEIIYYPLQKAFICSSFDLNMESRDATDMESLSLPAYHQFLWKHQQNHSFLSEIADNWTYSSDMNFFGSFYMNGKSSYQDEHLVNKISLCHEGLLQGKSQFLTILGSQSIDRNSLIASICNIIINKRCENNPDIVNFAQFLCWTSAAFGAVIDDGAVENNVFNMLSTRLFEFTYRDGLLSQFTCQFCCGDNLAFLPSTASEEDFRTYIIYHLLIDSLTNEQISKFQFPSSIKSHFNSKNISELLSSRVGMDWDQFRETAFRMGIKDESWNELFGSLLACIHLQMYIRRSYFSWEYPENESSSNSLVLHLVSAQELLGLESMELVDLFEKTSYSSLWCKLKTVNAFVSEIHQRILMWWTCFWTEISVNLLSTVDSSHLAQYPSSVLVSSDSDIKFSLLDVPGWRTHSTSMTFSDFHINFLNEKLMHTWLQQCRQKLDSMTSRSSSLSTTSSSSISILSEIDLFESMPLGLMNTLQIAGLQTLQSHPSAWDNIRNILYDRIETLLSSVDQHEDHSYSLLDDQGTALFPEDSSYLLPSLSLKIDAKKNQIWMQHSFDVDKINKDAVSSFVCYEVPQFIQSNLFHLDSNLQQRFQNIFQVLEFDILERFSTSSPFAGVFQEKKYVLTSSSQMLKHIFEGFNISNTSLQWIWAFPVKEFTVSSIPKALVSYGRIFHYFHVKSIELKSFLMEFQPWTCYSLILNPLRWKEPSNIERECYQVYLHILKEAWTLEPEKGSIQQLNNSSRCRIHGNFMSFPRSDYEDLKNWKMQIQQYVSSAAIYIQSRWRKYHTFHRFQRFHEALICLQSHFRRRKESEQVNNLRQAHLIVAKAIGHWIYIRRRRHQLRVKQWLSRQIFQRYILRLRLRIRRRRIQELQYSVRGFLIRKEVEHLAAAAGKIRRLIRKFLWRKLLYRKRYLAVLRLQKCVRGFLCRENYFRVVQVLQLRKRQKMFQSVVVKVQRNYRRYFVQSRFHRLREATIRLQSFCRTAIQRHRYWKLMIAVFRLQAFFRRCLAVKVLHGLKTEQMWKEERQQWKTMQTEEKRHFLQYYNSCRSVSEGNSSMTSCKGVVLKGPRYLGFRVSRDLTKVRGREILGLEIHGPSMEIYESQWLKSITSFIHEKCGGNVGKSSLHSRDTMTMNSKEEARLESSLNSKQIGWKGSTRSSTSLSSPRKGLGGVWIVDLFVGRDFTLLMDERGQLYGWGANHEGQLGLGHRRDRSPSDGLPEHLESLDQILKTALPVSSSSSMTSSSPGIVSSTSSPSLPSSFAATSTTSSMNISSNLSNNSLLSQSVIAQVSCGASHVFIRTFSGQVFSWGCNSRGQLGLPTVPIGSSCAYPRLVEGLLTATPASSLKKTTLAS